MRHRDSGSGSVKFLRSDAPGPNFSEATLAAVGAAISDGRLDDTVPAASATAYGIGTMFDDGATTGLLELRPNGRRAGATRFGSVPLPNHSARRTFWRSQRCHGYWSQRKCSKFRYQLARRPSVREVRSSPDLAVRIAEIHAALRQTYGVPGGSAPLCSMSADSSPIRHSAESSSDTLATRRALRSMMTSSTATTLRRLRTGCGRPT